jgi:hypothetical protein
MTGKSRDERARSDEGDGDAVVRPLATSKKLGRLLPVALIAAAAGAFALANDGVADGASAPTKIRIRIGGRTLTATVAPNKTARDFVSLLPLTLPMHDLFGREKAAALPRVLARGGKPRHTYAVGDIIYWPPSTDVAVYYRPGGPAIPDPGVVLLARLDSGAGAFNKPGTVRVRLERNK